MSLDPSVAVRAQGLSKVYQLYARPADRLRQMFWRGRRRYYREFVALQDVHFELRRGEVLGLVGRNGAGKSTLLQLICGTLAPSAGSVTVNGRIAALLELGAGFNPEFSGRENIYLNASVLGLQRAEIDARYEQIVEFSGIREFIDQPVKTYSSGMYVRLAFAIATSVDPDILVIDEALSVGDGAFARKSFDRIMELKERGATILFCSHSMYHIEAICNRALWLEKGRVAMYGEPAEVVTAFSAALMETEIPAGQGGQAPAAEPASAPAGRAWIDRITAFVDGVASERPKLRAGESDLLIRIEFSSDPELPEPSLAFGIETSRGQTVSSAGSLQDGIVLQRDKDGSGAVELHLPRLPLMRGEYRLSIFLGCERLVHIYDQAPNCLSFEVTQQGIEQGVVFLPHAWKASVTSEECSGG